MGRLGTPLVRCFRRFRARNTYPPRLLAFVLATIIAAVPMVAGAIFGTVWQVPSVRVLAGVAVLLALAFLAELRPVPFNAMTTRRSYRDPLSEEAALAELWAHAGTPVRPGGRGGADIAPQPHVTGTRGSGRLTKRSWSSSTPS